jgi:hypothetical protein
MLKLSIGCVMWCSANDMHHGSEVTGRCTITASTISSQLVQNVLAKHQILQVPQPPYSLIIAPCEFFLFPKVKMLLKEQVSRHTRDKMKHSLQKLAIPKS